MSRRRLLLASGGVRTPERLARLQAEMRTHFAGCRELLFVPWAQADHDGVLQSLQQRGFDAGFDLRGIHRAGDPVRAVQEAEALFIGGGNSFRLLSALQHPGLMEAIRSRVAAGMPYLGISAGTNVACPTIRTTNDMPIVEPPRGLRALGLIDFQINPHYFSGSVWNKNEAGELEPHCGETRDERLAEFHECNATPVLGLREGAILRVSGAALSLCAGEARLFQAGLPARDLNSPCEVLIPVR
jgi:dipeptidase E